MPLSAVTGTFDTIARTGSCELAGSLNEAPLVSFIVSTDPYSSIDALFHWDSFGLDGTTGVTGLISGELTFYNTATFVVEASQQPFSIVRGADCDITFGGGGGTDSTIIVPVG